MKDLFSETGERILESLTFTQTLYAFDFDGTLARIVPSPEDARASSETEKLLNELSTLAYVAVVSGRSISDLKAKLKTPIQYLIGNHGLEGLLAKPESFSLAKGTCDRWLVQLNAAQVDSELDSGITIENKTYSIALHYRRSRNKKKSKQLIIKQIQALTPAPRVIPGKCVLNLVPAGAPHKGVALLELIATLKLKCAFYIGDDDTDEDVFSLPDDRIVSVRVGRKKTSHAQFYIHRQTEINQVLRKLVALHKRTTKANRNSA